MESQISKVYAPSNATGRQLTITKIAHKAGVVGDLGMAARRVLAACDMAAERRRATALDRAYYLHLAEADMAGIGLPPRRPVVAEDIRASSSGRDMAAGCYAGGWSFSPVSGFLPGFLRGCDSRSSGLLMPAIMPVATRV